MNTYTIDELDREEIELLPSRTVMTLCNPCFRPCTPTIQVCLKVQLCCLGGVDANARF